MKIFDPAGNPAPVATESTAEIARLRKVVEAAYIDGALSFGGFSQEVADRALAKFNDGSDAKEWRDDPEYWVECQDLSSAPPMEGEE